MSPLVRVCQALRGLRDGARGLGLFLGALYWYGVLVLCVAYALTRLFEGILGVDGDSTEDESNKEKR